MSNIHLHITGSETFANLLSELDLNYTIISGENLKYKKHDSLVRIILVEQLQIADTKKYFLENIPTIFLLNNRNFLLNNKLRLLDFHVSLFTPIDLLSFKEILNILIAKYNFFKKSKITIGNYEIDSNQRVIIKDETKVKITEKELELILMLHKNNGLEKSYLLKNIWNQSFDLESHAFETSLHRLRKKINKFFKDKKFITEKNYLYYLLK
jgi:hypothetical protein